MGEAAQTDAADNNSHMTNRTAFGHIQSDDIQAAIASLTPLLEMQSTTIPFAGG